MSALAMVVAVFVCAVLASSSGCYDGSRVLKRSVSLTSRRNEWFEVRSEMLVSFLLSSIHSVDVSLCTVERCIRRARFRVTVEGRSVDVSDVVVNDDGTLFLVAGGRILVSSSPADLRAVDEMDSDSRCAFLWSASEQNSLPWNIRPLVCGMYATECSAWAHCTAGSSDGARCYGEACRHRTFGPH